MIKELFIDILIGCLIVSVIIILMAFIFKLIDLISEEPTWIIPIAGTVLGIIIYVW